jgi:aspartyl-tRNA(Asn)/glutamyl-tRNA(Gln) amidotransferase subunit A
MNLLDLTLTDAGRKLHEREISALELTDFYLARLAALNPTLNAFITVTAESARAAARRADEQVGRGTDSSALLGLPLALKDLFDTRGAPTTAGSKILSDRVPQEDATVTARLREAGAVLVGKTNMHEWAFGVTNDNPHFGATHNPWDTQRIPGGSSGGSAAAVAARLCLGALGTDTGGSIRIPAALCGVTGLKPTYGRVSLHGVIPLSWSMDHAGPLAQTAEDCALILQCIAGYDPLDPASVNALVPDYAATLNRPVEGLRLAVPAGFLVERVDEEILNAVHAATRAFADLGAQIVYKDLPQVEDLIAVGRLRAAEAAAYHREYLETRAEEYGADVLQRLRAGAAVPMTDYAMWKRQQAELRRGLELFFDDVDLLVTPTTRIVAPRFDSFGDAVVMAQDLTAFTVPFNLTGFPAISLPCGFTREGLPIGLQLVARPWREALLLQAAHQYQLLTDWHRRRPPVPDMET